MKEQLNNIINDLEIIKEAINNGDSKDAIQMLNELSVDLKVIVVMC